LLIIPQYKDSEIEVIDFWTGLKVFATAFAFGFGWNTLVNELAKWKEKSLEVEYMNLGNFKIGDLVRRKDKKSAGKLFDFGTIDEITRKHKLAITGEIRKELGNEVVVMQKEIGYLLVKKDKFLSEWEKGKLPEYPI